jgi:small GTP-binding protein
MLKKKIVVIGHVDTGKSTLVGHLLVKLNVINEHDATQIKEKAIRDNAISQIYSRMTDIYAEEMEKGKTHEFSEFEFIYNNTKYTLIDTPGHQSYVRSMIAGLSRNVKNAIIMVSMKDNEFKSSFEDGMLKEHLTLAKANGIKNLIIVANKMSLINWNKDDCKTKLSKVINFLSKNLNYNVKDIRVCAIDAYDGINLIDTDKDVPDWVKESLITMIEKYTDSDSKSDSESKSTLTSISSDKIIINVKILQLPIKELITKMFRCHLHFSNGKESDGVIIDIKDKIYLKSLDTATITFKLDNQISIDDVTYNIILRKNDYTIGYKYIDI